MRFLHIENTHGVETYINIQLIESVWAISENLTRIIPVGAGYYDVMEPIADVIKRISEAEDI